MVKRYTYRAYPNKTQQIYFAKMFGACRWVYNWALGLKKKDYEENKDKEGYKFISIYDISKMLTKKKYEQGFEWLQEVSSASLLHSLSHLDLAYKNFFRKIKAGIKTSINFKARGYEGKFSFHQGYSIDFDKGYMKIPKAGKLNVIFHRKIEGVSKTVTVIKNKANQYYVSIVVHDNEIAEPVELNIDRLVGIDHGVINALTLSDGSRFETNMNFIKEWKREVKLQRELSRKKIGSNNREKARVLLAKKSLKVANKRKYNIENVVCELVEYLLENNYCGAVVRKYDIKDMVKVLKPVVGENGGYEANGRGVQKKLNKKIMNSAMGIVRQQIKYKLEQNGLHYLEFDANKTKTTQKCRWCKSEDVEIDLRTRIMKCNICYGTDDIDFNAAVNTLECVDIVGELFEKIENIRDTFKVGLENITGKGLAG